MKREVQFRNAFVQLPLTEDGYALITITFYLDGEKKELSTASRDLDGAVISFYRMLVKDFGLRAAQIERLVAPLFSLTVDGERLVREAAVSRDLED